MLRRVQDVVLDKPGHLATIIKFKQIEFLDTSATSEGWHVQWETVPPGNSQDPVVVSWVAFAEETKRMKPTDKPILGMVSESPGRNASEPTGGLDRK